MLPKNLVDVVSEQYNPRWSALRKVGHAAVLDFARRPQLMDIIADSVDQTVSIIKKKHGTNKPFDPSDYIYLTVINVLATTSFGKRYNYDDEEFVKVKSLFEKNNDNAKYFFVFLLPGFKKILQPLTNYVVKPMFAFYDYLKDQYMVKVKNYQDDIINTFADSVIAATKKSQAEQKESVPYLTDHNLTMVLFDLFLAGTDTTQYTLRWELLIMATYPEIQKKLREEIAEQLGDRIATQEDKSRCHYVNAFITEVLRLRNIAPLGVAHMTTCDTVLGDYKLPKGTLVQVMQGAIMKDERYWKEPEKFSPDRHLADGKFVEPHRGYLPFGIGRRVCLGEKLAMADLFFITVRLLQATAGYELAFPIGQRNDLKPARRQFLCVPKNYKLVLKPVK